MLREILQLYVKDVDERYLNPASIDLPLSDEAYRLEEVFLPPPGCMVRSMLSRVGATQHDLGKPLEVGVPYLIKVAGHWELPKITYGYVNPKSSAGRVFGLFRTVADGVAMYDALTPAGWKGELWVLARADAFPLLVSPGLAVSQLRLFDGPNFLGPLDSDFAIRRHGLLFGKDKKRLTDLRRHQDSFFLSLATELGGWECRGTNKILDMSKVAAYDSGDFFEPLKPVNGTLKLRKGSFYLLSTHERVMVPPTLSAELRAMDPRFGEFRSHSAGYIDPGWGWGTDGSVCGRPITLELTLFEDREVRVGENIARVRYEWMKEAPELLYDQSASNYTEQEGVALAKFFKK